MVTTATGALGYNTGGVAYNFDTGFGIVTLASNTTSVVSAPISGVIFGGGALNKEGPGLMQVSGVNTYTGATNANAGTLRFTVSETLSALNIANGAIVELSAVAPAPALFDEGGMGGGRWRAARRIVAGRAGARRDRVAARRRTRRPGSAEAELVNRIFVVRTRREGRRFS